MGWCCRGKWRGASLRQAPVRSVLEAMPRALAGMFAVLTLAVVSCVVALVLAYLVVHGPTHQAFDSYTRKVGQVFNPAVTLIFVLKTLFFSLAVSLIPTVSGMNRG
ncbi:ABC transporter permease [Candidatus Skiveiella danica]|uniref:ABC transporter permease n=1 Tax=Candidatus Skiveiella danica TaxID=3386177 RepID=UPI0039B857E9